MSLIQDEVNQIGTNSGAMSYMCIKFNLNLLMIPAILALTVVASPASAAGLKIGFVSAQKVIEEAPQSEQAQKALQKEFDPRKKELDEMKKSVKKLEDRLNRDGAVMSEAERLKLERELRSQSRELKRASEEFKEDLVIRQNQAFERLRQRVFEVIQIIAKKNKYDLIVSDGVLYASDPVNITDLVLKELRKEMDGKSGGADNKPKS